MFQKNVSYVSFCPISDGILNEITVTEKYKPDHAHQNFVHPTLHCVQASETPQKFVLTACYEYYILSTPVTPISAGYSCDNSTDVNV